MLFYPEEAMREWRRLKMDGKFKLIEDWTKANGIEVIMIDTANDFYRGNEDSSKETSVGAMFDMFRNLPLKARIPVRHDRKRRENDSDGAYSNELIRGSGEWKEDPEVILYLRREDRRTHMVYFEVGKLRYGRKPEPVYLWFDAVTFRLTPLPPPIAVLLEKPRSREEIIIECERRFGISQSKTDELLREQAKYVRTTFQGHSKVYEIDPDHIASAPWADFLPGTGPQIIHGTNVESEAAIGSDGAPAGAGSRAVHTDPKLLGTVGLGGGSEINKVV
jgi:hypothetical protein